MTEAPSSAPDAQSEDMDDEELATTLVRSRRATRRDPMAESAYLVSVRGPTMGENHTLRTGKVIVGRGEQTDIRLVDDTISRQHAKFVRSLDGTVHLVDLGSTNGSFVNGSKIDVAVLSEGDLIELGDCVLRFTRREPNADVVETSGPVPEHQSAQPMAANNRPNERQTEELRQLSDRQLEVARAVVLGLSNAEIGKRLSISPRTVSTHLENIYKRLRIGSRAELVHLLTLAGLSEPNAA